jgi:hypothetical protein
MAIVDIQVRTNEGNSIIPVSKVRDPGQDDKDESKIDACK